MFGYWTYGSILVNIYNCNWMLGICFYWILSYAMIVESWMAIELIFCKVDILKGGCFLVLFAKLDIWYWTFTVCIFYFFPDRKRYPNLNSPCDALGQSSSVGLKKFSFDGSSVKSSGVHLDSIGMFNCFFMIYSRCL